MRNLILSPNVPTPNLYPYKVLFTAARGIRADFHVEHVAKRSHKCSAFFAIWRIMDKNDPRNRSRRFNREWINGFYKAVSRASDS